MFLGISSGNKAFLTGHFYSKNGLNHSIYSALLLVNCKHIWALVASAIKTPIFVCTGFHIVISNFNGLIQIQLYLIKF